MDYFLMIIWRLLDLQHSKFLYRITKEINRDQINILTIYLNCKFSYFIFETVQMITLLQRRKKPQSSLVSMTFEIWSPKNMYNPGRMLDIWAKNEVDTTIGIGGVCET